jgi:hypothetical protein
MKCPLVYGFPKGEMKFSLGHGGFGGSLEAPPNGDRTAKCSLVLQWLNAMNAPQKLLPENICIAVI